MADDTDKPLDDNENMLKALESIKSLLATSETKLTQARKSISQASAQSLKMSTEVPVLEDVIVPGKPPPTTTPPDATPPPKPTPSANELSTLQTRLETEMHEKLLEFAQQLELELKQKIKDYIEEFGPSQTKK